MKSLKLFNAVISKQSNESAFISFEEGIIIEPNALWLKERILDYYKTERLNGNDLNKTFHKSWRKIKDSSRFELFTEQIRHYISTYGSNFQDEVYIPDEVLEVPSNLKFKTVKAYTEKELTNKCFSLLKSGIALKEETINDVLSLLVDELKYEFTGNENIKNKEAIIKIADLYGVIPDNTIEFFRFIIYRATGQSLLIKNDEIIEAIKNSNFNPSVYFNKFGLIRLSEIFNRFKPLFLAFKTQCSKTINKISKLSKTHHKPLKENPLNKATSELLIDNEYLDKATIFHLLKALSACYTRMQGQDKFVYRIRNGKSWTEKRETKNVNKDNFTFILEYLKSKYDFSGVRFYFPQDVKYGLPTSEKMFTGGIPAGTKFYGDKLAVGIYWQNDWGARDLDLSGINEINKIGWNAGYSQNGQLMYSGDMTNAENGAVEYLYSSSELNYPTLIKNNVFSGKDDCKFKIIIGKGEDIDKKYMMNPNNLFASIKTQSVQKQSILGILLNQCFVLLNFGAGNLRISGDGEISKLTRKALIQQYKNSLSFNEIIRELGGEIVEDKEEAIYDFSLDSVEKDKFIKIFE